MKEKFLKIGLKKATIELMLLKLLDEGEMYGYQLAQELKKRSSGEFILMEGSMYPILYRLEESGFISSEKRLAGKRMTRVYYNLTPEGKKHYEELLNEFRDSIELLDFLLNSKEGDKYKKD